MKAKKSLMGVLWPFLKQNILKSTCYLKTGVRSVKAAPGKKSRNLKALEERITESGKLVESSKQNAERLEKESKIPRILPDAGKVVKYHDRDKGGGEGPDVQMSWREDEDEDRSSPCFDSAQHDIKILFLTDHDEVQLEQFELENSLVPLLLQKPGNEVQNPAYRRFGILLVLVLMMGMHSANVKAQEFMEPEPYSIGDQVEDVEIGDLLNSKTGSIRISDYKGKLLIIDFWATWCNFSTSLFNKEDSLEQKFNGKVAFLPVSYQSREEISHFLTELRENSPASLPKKEIRVATGDHVLRRMFPHVTLPHFVWIGPDGIVKAITGFEDLTEPNITQVLNGQELKVALKKEIRIPYDPDKPLLLVNNGGDGINMFYHSVFTKYTVGLAGEGRFFRNDPVKGAKITVSNFNIRNLYKFALGNGSLNYADNRIVYEVKDPGRINSTKTGGEYDNWLKQDNGFCYELIVPPALSSRIFELMVQDLDRVFPQYNVKLEKRNTKCLALVRTSKVDKLKSKNGKPDLHVEDFELSLSNGILFNFINPLNAYYLQNNPLPVIDETGYTAPVDLQIKASLKDVSALNRELAKYDLKFIETEKIIEIMVFRDRKI